MGLPASGGGGARGFLNGLAVLGAFLLLFILQARLLVVPLRQDARPLSWDPSVHMRAAWRYGGDVAAGRWTGLLSPPRTPGHPPYPPLTHLAMAACARLSALLGLDVEDAATLANLFFMMLLAWGVYLLASDWWGEAAGAAAAAMSLFLPPFLVYERMLLVDVALAAWVALSYAVWARSRSFTLWRESVLLGLVGAAGLLTKWTYFLYVLPILGAGFWEAAARRKGPALRFLVALLLAGLIAAPWYAANAASVLIKVTRAAELGAQEGDPTGGLDALFYYFNVMKDGVGWIGLATAAAGFLWLVGRTPQNGWVLASWLGSSYGVWTLVSNKDPRYILPALVTLPLAAAALPFRIPLLLAALLGGAAYLPSSRFQAERPREAWPLKDILEKAASFRTGPAGPPETLTLLANHESMNGNNMLWTAEREGLDHAITVRSRSSGLGEFTDFVLVKTGDLGPVRTVAGHEKAREEALRPDGWFQRQFSKEETWRLPDRSEAVLFRRLPVSSAPVVEMDPAGVLSRLVPGLAAEGLKASCGGGAVLRGEGDCAVEASSLRVSGLMLKDVRLDLRGWRVTADDEGRPRVLDLGEVRVSSLRVDAESAARLLSLRAKALKAPSVNFLAGNEVEVAGKLMSAPLRARARIAYDPAAGAVKAEILSVRFLGIPCPAALLRGKIFEASLRPHAGWPWLAVLSGLKTVPSDAGGALEVSP